MAKLNTIKVSGGGDYAKVAERLKEFHKTYGNGKIETSYNLTEAMICFKTIITPNVEKPERFFTGHSLGKIAGVKAFEKLETISAGRALAFLGLLADGEIASADEMEEYEKAKTKTETKKPKANILEVCEKIEKIKTKAKIEEFRSWVNNVKSYTEEQKNVMLRKLEEQEKICV